MIFYLRVFFSDSSENKLRPCIILSDNKYHKYGYLLVTPITTSIDDYCLPISKKDVSCILDKNSSARFDGIIRLHKNQVIKRIGKITQKFHGRLVNKIIDTIK